LYITIYNKLKSVLAKLKILLSQ